MVLRTIGQFVLVIAMIAIAAACDEYLGSVDCDDCYFEKPDSEDLVIHLTIDDRYPEVPIFVYRGNVEDGHEDWVDTARESPYYLYSAVDQYYSVAAEYQVGAKKIVAIDGDMIEVKHVSSSCDYECWVTTGGYLKVELKFDD